MEKLYNKTVEFFNMTDFNDLNVTMSLHSWVILPIALPTLCVAIYGLCSLIKADHVAPVYVINLLISDVLQVCAKPICLSVPPSGVIYELVVFAFTVGVLASTVFMVCIAGERYVMIAHPLWYRFHRTITQSLLCSFAVWMATVAVMAGTVLASVTEVIGVENVVVCTSVGCLLPYPFVMFFFVGTWRALSRSQSVSPREQRRIMGTLALVLIIYTALFLPNLVLMVILKTFPGLITDTLFQRLVVWSSTLLSLNPMVDPILYVFMRKKNVFVLPCRRCRRCGHHKQTEQGETEFSPPLSASISAGETHV